MTALLSLTRSGRIIHLNGSEMNVKFSEYVILLTSHIVFMYILLYYIILYYIFIILYYIILYYIILYYIILYYIIFISFNSHC